MPQRDDDPVHPNFDGISFNPTTDGQGVVVHPASGNIRFPLTYLTVPQAEELRADLAAIREKATEGDAKSYLAVWLGDLIDDLTAAIDGSSAP